MESKEKKHLVRIACYEGDITVDATGRAKGRGAYICRGDVQCLEKAYKRKALERSFGRPVTKEQKDEIFRQLKDLEDNGKQN